MNKLVTTLTNKIKVIPIEYHEQMLEVPDDCNPFVINEEPRRLSAET